jgi:hypothetical protein
MEISMEAPQKLKVDLLYIPVIPLLGIYPKECKPGYHRAICTPMFISALFTVAMLLKQPRCPTTDEWIKKIWLYREWSIIQTQRRMKLCHLQVNGWNWRPSC